ncbi:MAG: PD-(D/E)XK nuclease family protein [Candidatus Yanofskybacteria bacterium]|nr:PD-(D/E)XK nuclease family protein [Candidatus Yanofskybacteria bacterium]
MPTNTLKISRSGLRLFLECPRCFWLDLHHKIKRPPSYPYTLSAAVDYLVKQEFDKYRIKGELPPVFRKYFEANPARSNSADRQTPGRASSGARLYAGPKLAEWRSNFKGISYFDQERNAILYGAVDDVLQFPDGSLAVVDYKSSGSKEITIYEDYQKQMDTYSHILQKIGYKTQPNAYFVFYVVQKDGGGFQNSLPFREELRSVPVNTDWVERTFNAAVEVARQDKPPVGSEECNHCNYVSRASRLMNID